MGRDTSLGRRYACPCCDHFTLIKPPTGGFETCPVCWWEDDNVQYEDLDHRGGANGVSLREARESFLTYGVSNPEHPNPVVRRGRPPLPEELP